MNRHESETLTIVAGRTSTFQGWIPSVYKGRRQNLVALDVFLDLDVDVATADIQGEDLWRFIQLLQIEDVAGERWNMSGAGSRIMSGLLTGWRSFHEHADVAQGSGETPELALRIPFRKRFAAEPRDYEWSVEEFKRLSLLMGDSTTLDIGSSAVTFNSGTVRAVAYTRDVDEVHWGIRDVCREVAMQSQTQHALVLNGAYLAECFGYVLGASGGADMANWVDHRLDGIIDLPWERDPDVQQFYRYEREQGDVSATIGSEVFGSDPFLASTVRAALVHLPATGHKLTELPFVDTQAILRVGTGVASTILGVRTVEPKSATTENSYKSRYGLTDKDWRIATADGRNTERSAWGELAKFMPQRAPISRLRT